MLMKCFRAVSADFGGLLLTVLLVVAHAGPLRDTPFQPSGERCVRKHLEHFTAQRLSWRLGGHLGLEEMNTLGGLKEHICCSSVILDISATIYSIPRRDKTRRWQVTLTFILPVREQDDSPPSW